MSDESKAELLSKLKISQEPDTAFKKRNYLTYLGLVAVTSLAMFALLHFWPDIDTVKTAQELKAGNEQSIVAADPAQTPSQLESSVQPNVKTALVTNPEILNASGYVTARVSATVSSEILGRIESVLVEEGMRVTKGQVLAELDAAVARVDWQLAEARVVAITQRVAAAQSEQLEAERVLKRILSIDNRAFTSESAVTRAEANLARFEAELNALKADLKVAKLGTQRQKELLDRHTLRAPFSGVVTVKNAQPGEIIAPSSAGGSFTRTGICTIVDMESLEIEVDVNEAYIGRVFDEQKIVAKLDAYPDWKIPAKVIAVIPAADRAKASVRVRIGLLLKDSRILPNMGVKVAFFDEAH